MADEPSELAGRIDELLASAVEEQAREQRQLSKTLSDMQASLERVVHALSAVTEEATGARGATAGVAEALSREIAGAATQLAVRIDTLETAVGQLLAANVVEEPAALRRNIEEVAAAIGAVQETLGGSEVESRLDRLEKAIERLMSATRDRATSLERALGDAAGGLEQTLLEQVADLESGMLDRIGTFERTTSDRVGEIDTQARKTFGEMKEGHSAWLDTADRTIKTRLQRFEDELRAERAAVDAMAERTERFERSIVAYLRARDEVLEDERDRAFVELILDGLSDAGKRERARTTGRMRRVAESRRDRRDAKRFREGTRAAPMPEIDEAILREAVEEIVAAREPEEPSEPPIELEVAEGGLAGLLRPLDTPAAGPGKKKPRKPAKKPAAKPGMPARAAKEPAAKKPAAKKPAAKKPAAKKKEPAPKREPAAEAPAKPLPAMPPEAKAPEKVAKAAAPPRAPKLAPPRRIERPRPEPTPPSLSIVTQRPAPASTAPKRTTTPSRAAKAMPAAQKSATKPGTAEVKATPAPKPKAPKAKPAKSKTAPADESEAPTLQALVDEILGGSRRPDEP